MNKIYTIPAGISFGDALAEHMLGWYGDDPVALSRCLIFLPSRRSTLALRDAFFRQTGGKPLLLPRIQALGDADIDALIPELLYGRDAMLADIPEVMPPLTRLGHLRRKITEYYRNKEQELPEEQAIGLAGSLAELLDSCDREQVPYARIRALAPQEYAHHWELSLELLDIVFDWWPKQLAREGKVDSLQRRNMMLGMLKQAWDDAPPATPVIVAGTTGSIPATADLICTISRLPEGKLILPGFDSGMDGTLQDALSPSHPQWGMVRLIAHCGLKGAAVEELLPMGGNPHAHFRALWSHAMLPTDSMVHWHEERRESWDDVLDALHLLECDSEEEEALAITLLLRETMEQKDKKALLVTHDRTLARRVGEHLKAYGIIANDSAGKPLIQTAAARMFLHLADVLLLDKGSAALLALLKHPLALFGISPGQVRVIARELEIGVLRNHMPESLERVLYKASMSATLSPDAKVFAARILTLRQEAKQESQATFGTFLARHLGWLKDAVSSAPEHTGDFWQRHDAMALLKTITRLQDSAEALGAMSRTTYRGILVQVLGEEHYRPPFANDARIDILSPMEARMQCADRMILAGMNEDSWPGAPHFNAWLSVAMQQRVGLPGIEQQVGLAAHDVVQLGTGAEVFLTRTTQCKGVTLQATRWWQRIETFLAVQGVDVDTWKARTSHWKYWAVQKIAQAQEVRFAPPEFAPPLHTRPVQYSPTGIEKLMRDPYAFYAEKILNIKPLDALDTELERSVYGTAFHAALRSFVQAYPDILPEDAEAQLLAFGTQHFAAFNDEPHVQIFWWPKFVAVVAAFIAEEKTRRDERGISVTAEVQLKHEYALPTPVVIKAHADRIEATAEGGATIIDYKTGTVPSKADVELGISPQLSVEAFVLEDMTGVQVSGLEYWKLGGADLLNITAMGGTKKTVETIVSEARHGCLELLRYFLSEHAPFIALPHQQQGLTFNDYAHLERIKEWNY